MFGFPDDPLGVLPESLPAGPRVLFNQRDIERARRFASEYRWAREAMSLTAVAGKVELPPTDGSLHLLGNGKSIISLAVAAALSGNEFMAGQLICYLVQIARNYRTLAPNPDGSRVVELLHTEKMLMARMAEAYDLCVELADADTSAREEIEHLLFRPALSEVLWLPGHNTCGNHHTTALLATLAVGGALGDLKLIHAAFYGYVLPDGELAAGIAH